MQIKRKHQSSESLSRATVPLLRYAPLTWQRYGGSGTGYESLAFVRGIHRRPANSPHKWPVTRKMFPFDDVIMSGDDLSPRHCLNQGWLTLMAHVHTINDPFYWHGLTLIPAWISNHIQCKMGDDITYPFSNFNGCSRWSFGMDKLFHPTLHWACAYLCIQGFQLIYLCKKGTKPRRVTCHHLHLLCELDNHTKYRRHNGRDGVSNHLRLGCLLNRLFRRRPKKTL